MHLSRHLLKELVNAVRILGVLLETQRENVPRLHRHAPAQNLGEAEEDGEASGSSMFTLMRISDAEGLQLGSNFVQVENTSSTCHHWTTWWDSLGVIARQLLNLHKMFHHIHVELNTKLLCFFAVRGG